MISTNHTGPEILETQHWICQQFKGRGEIEFEGRLRFAGEWNGVVKSTQSHSHLYVSENARIQGQISVAELTVAGKLVDIEVDVDVFRALAGAVVVGNVRARHLVIDDGAVVQGRIVSKNAQ